MTFKKDFLYWNFNIKEWITLLSSMAMMLGFLYSRALLSIGMIALFVIALDPRVFKENWHRWKNNRFAVLCFLFFAAYLLSGLWSENLDRWQDSIQTKLPFLVLPFAMLSAPFGEKKLQRYIIYSVLIALLSGILYSSSFLLTHPQYLTNGAHLPSPAKRDYIRFTIAIVLGLQFVFYLFIKQKEFFLKKTEKILLITWSVFAVIYLHIEAAKSGLLCLYLLIGIYLLFKCYKRYGITKIILAMIIALAGLFIAAATFPALKRQWHRLKMEKAIWESENTSRYNKVSSIVPRLVSFQAAFVVIKKHPFYGVGAGDLMQEMDKVYQSDFPFMRTTLVPHNQLLCTAVILGIPLTLILILMLLAPLRKRSDIYTISTFLIMVCGVSIGPIFEVQFGVFVYLFFTLFWMMAPGLKTTSTAASSVLR